MLPPARQYLLPRVKAEGHSKKASHLRRIALSALLGPNRPRKGIHGETRSAAPSSIQHVAYGTTRADVIRAAPQSVKVFQALVEKMFARRLCLCNVDDSVASNCVWEWESATAASISAWVAVQVLMQFRTASCAKKETRDARVNVDTAGTEETQPATPF